MSAAAAALLYLVAYVGLRRSLAKFPWEIPWRDDLGRTLSGQGNINSAGDAGLVGWPFERLRPKWPAATGISTRDALLVSMLAGWWLYAVASLFSDPGTREGFIWMVHLSAAAFLTFGRLAIYRAGCAPPINTWGRLWTFRWIIPGYDRVYVAPSAAMLIGVLAPSVAAAHGVAPEFGVPPSLSLTLLAGLSLGPSLLNWHLTGQHRLVPGARVQQRCIKVG